MRRHPSKALARDADLEDTPAFAGVSV